MIGPTSPLIWLFIGKEFVVLFVASSNRESIKLVDGAGTEASDGKMASVGFASAPDV